MTNEADYSLLLTLVSIVSALIFFFIIKHAVYSATMKAWRKRREIIKNEYEKVEFMNDHEGYSMSEYQEEKNRIERTAHV